MTKTSRPTVRIHDLETNEIIDREMNDAEFAEYEIMQAASAEKLAAMEQKTAEKAALLARLGLTEDEAKLLLS